MKRPSKMPQNDFKELIDRVGRKTKIRASKGRIERYTRLPMSKVQKLLWNECKRIIRARDKGVCFTCGATELVGSNAQTGHFIPNSTCGAYLRYDLRNLALQCMRCNIHGGGMGAEFYRRLVLKHGQEFVDQLFRDKNKIVKARDHYEMLLEQYRSYPQV